LGPYIKQWQNYMVLKQERKKKQASEI
jgi:hypothetical protein